MTCEICGRYTAPDPDTGYDADRLCSFCEANGWTVTNHGEVINENDAADEPARCPYCGDLIDPTYAPNFPYCGPQCGINAELDA